LNYLKVIVFKELLKRGSATLTELKKELGVDECLISGLLRDYGEHLEVSGDEVKVEEPVGLVMRLWREGASVLELLRALNWKGFEEFCGRLFREASYLPLNNLRFSHLGRRYEVDVIALKRPYLIAVDCKRWKRALRGMVVAFVEKHLERCRALSEALWSIRRLSAQLNGWEEAIVVPTLLTALEEEVKLIEGVPIVPLFKLKGFLNELGPALLDSLTSFRSRRREEPLN